MRPKIRFRDIENAILEILNRSPEGLAREVIESQVRWKGRDPQAFRRILTGLIARGEIYAKGNTKARRYFPPLPAPSSVQVQIGEHSPEGTEVLALVNRPLEQRTPCSYERGFLDAYGPNETFYLRLNDRERLRALGRTPDLEQPAGTYGRKILERLLIDLSWNSSRLEGNTYSLLDTERLINEGRAPEGKDAQETQMVLNHKQAVEYLVEGAGELNLTPTAIRTLHGMLSENLLANPADEGRLRQTGVGIAESTYIPLAVPQMIAEIFEQVLLTAAEIQDPFEQSFFLLVHIPYLQPFVDANKRTSRLAANLPLLKKNLQPLSFTDLPREVYTQAMLAIYETRRIEALRDVYLWAYQRSAARYQAIRESMVQPDPFRLRYRNQLRELVRSVVQSNSVAEEVRLHIQVFASTSIPTEDRNRFQAATFQEIRNLNEGTYSRYGIRPSEFDGWHLELEKLLREQ